MLFLTIAGCAAAMAIAMRWMPEPSGQTGAITVTLA